ncbi:MAG: Lon protease 2 [Calditrichaeota bacterium]|nr:Lon protease 2 [Calditrichota bacterium]
MNENPRAPQPEAGTIPGEIPLFVTRDLVIFPGLIVPLTVTDPTFSRTIDHMTERGRRTIGLFLRRPEAKDDEKTLKSVHRIGTALTIHRMMRAGEGMVRMIVQGLQRVELQDLTQTDPFPIGRVKVREHKPRRTVQLEALMRALKDDFEKIAELSPNLPDELKMAVRNMDNPSALADMIGAHIELDEQVRQQLLSAIKVPERMRLLRELLDRELRILRVGSQIQDKARGEMEKSQREYILRQQLREIRKELGEDDEQGGEAEKWREKAEAADLPERVMEVASEQIKRLERINPASAEYSVVTTYLDWLVSLPWEKLSEDNLDLKHAKRVLDDDHYGLDDIKDRILEVLAVRKLKPDAQGSILCLVGPPGVGKTSLGKSVARAMGRRFIRVSLGGVRDEAEIRGHRRTYVGALPGRILQKMKEAGTRNPVFMLDEVDKLVSDFRGDPSSALLEVLDPAQNDTFSDHYIEIPFDLSKVLFITTANYAEMIPPPLQDRMEIIRLPGYITAEKVEIGRQYLVKRQIEANGLDKGRIRFSRAALREITNYYTRESGVRNLERAIGTICRKVAYGIATGEIKDTVSVKKGNVHEFLGPRKVTPPWVNRKPEVGVTNGLAYTPVGGSVLQVETARMPGKGNFRVTGQLGEVMQESAQIAMSWIRAHQDQLGIEQSLLENSDTHIHVPEGATKKDGPSAGITMTTSIASLFTGRRVRSDAAMTGEITLTGHVLPIGGLREKVVAANRARIKHVIIPEDNEKDLEKVPEDVREQIEFHSVKTISQVLELALEEEGARGRDGRVKKRAAKSGTDGNGRAPAKKREPAEV